jgi:hypothetical protein
MVENGQSSGMKEMRLGRRAVTRETHALLKNARKKKEPRDANDRNGRYARDLGQEV